MEDGMEPVEHVSTRAGMTVDELAREMGKSGVFGAGRLAKAIDLIEKMIRDEDTVVFLGLAGAMVPGGMKRIIRDMILDGWIDVLVTTGANLVHDMVEALGHRHYKGSPVVDDRELHKKGIDRIYDSFMPDRVYESLEEFFNKHSPEVSGKKMNTREFLWWLGEKLDSEESILSALAKKRVPVYCPAIADSAIGLQLWSQRVFHKRDIQVDTLDDLREMMDTTWKNKKLGAIYIGGGVPKNYIQQALQFSPEASWCTVQITMDRPEHGGSSGAEPKEGISWGKLHEQGEWVNLVCDATIALPVISAALKERLANKEK